MRKKPRNVHYPSFFDNPNTSFSALLDIIDPCAEREAQRQEYLKRQKKDAPKTSPKKPAKPCKSNAMSFEEKLERTNQWLQETFPALFGPSQPCKALDVHIIRDIKAHYKQGYLKKKYPSDLVIKAALYRYMESPEYLSCLRESAPRYNIKGEIAGTV